MHARKPLNNCIIFSNSQNSLGNTPFFIGKRIPISALYLPTKHLRISNNKRHSAPAPLLLHHPAKQNETEQHS